MPEASNAIQSRVLIHLSASPCAPSPPPTLQHLTFSTEIGNHCSPLPQQPNPNMLSWLALPMVFIINHPSLNYKPSSLTWSLRHPKIPPRGPQGGGFAWGRDRAWSKVGHPTVTLDTGLWSGQWQPVRITERAWSRSEAGSAAVCTWVSNGWCARRHSHPCPESSSWPFSLGKELDSSSKIYWREISERIKDQEVTVSYTCTTF